MTTLEARASSVVFPFCQSENTLALPQSALVIGPNSFIGQEFIRMVGLGSEIYAAGRAGRLYQSETAIYLRGYYDVDLLNPQQILTVIDRFPGAYVINFAASTDVNGVEKTRPHNPWDEDLLRQNEAYRINALAVYYLAQACRETGKILVSFSSDFARGVYDPNDASWYAYTKALGDQFLFDSGVRYVNPAIAFPYGEPSTRKLDFIRGFLKEYDDKKGERMTPKFSDQIIHPTHIPDIAHFIKFVMETDFEGEADLVSPTGADLRQILVEVLKQKGVGNAEEIIPEGSLAKYMRDNPSYAIRPLHSPLNPENLIQSGFDHLTSWQEGIRFLYCSTKNRKVA